MGEDSRDAALRYRLRKEAAERGEDPPEDDAPASRVWTPTERAAIVEVAIEQAIRRGDFDDLPGAGKPIPGLGETSDPDWWIRRKIERERLTGLGPPALLLRTEYAGLSARLDELRSEADVREHLEDFNRRVIEARRQLLGGPPVVTPTVEIDEWVRSWNDRRQVQRTTPAPPRTAARWRFRRSGR
jgi:hypothetical protein